MKKYPENQIIILKLGAWWQKVYNTIREHSSNSDMTPCEKLKSLGYATAQEFYLFPTLILDRLVALPETKNAPVSVQEHLNYDLFGQKLYCSTRTHFGQIIKLLDTGLSTI